MTLLILSTANPPSLCLACSILAGFFFFAGAALVRYTKPALTFEDQADQLLARGLVAERDVLIDRLKCVSYYRLSGYWHTFRESNDRFRPGTSLDTVWSFYTFDRRLRLLVLDGIERVEVSVRTELVYRLSHSHGPFAYLESRNLPNLSSDQFEQFINGLSEQYGKSRESFVTHFRDKYGDEHDLPPLWMATELLSLGALQTLFRGAEKRFKRDVAQRYGIRDEVLGSWLGALNTVRNTCAHHSRLWNRELGYKPMIPNKDPRWHRPVSVTQHRVFGILTILRYFMRDIAPQSGWPGRFEELLAAYPGIPISQMGMPSNWRACPIWAE